jgi:hypothetical protein
VTDASRFTTWASAANVWWLIGNEENHAGPETDPDRAGDRGAVVVSSSETEELETLRKSGRLERLGGREVVGTPAGKEGVLPLVPADFSTSTLASTATVLAFPPTEPSAFSAVAAPAFFLVVAAAGLRPPPLAAAAGLSTAFCLSFADPAAGLLPLLPEAAAGLSTALTLRMLGAPAPGAGVARDEGGALVASPLACRGPC